MSQYYDIREAYGKIFPKKQGEYCQYPLSERGMPQGAKPRGASRATERTKGILSLFPRGFEVILQPSPRGCRYIGILSSFLTSATSRNQRAHGTGRVHNRFNLIKIVIISLSFDVHTVRFIRDSVKFGLDVSLKFCPILTRLSLKVSLSKRGLN